MLIPRAAKEELMLEAVGVSEIEERIYRALLRQPPASLDDLAERSGTSRSDLQPVLASLEAHGLVSRTSDDATTYAPAPPDVAVESLVLGRQEQLEQVRLASVELVRDYHDGMRDRPGKSPTELVEIVVGREAIAQRFEQLQRHAKHEVMVLDRPPYTVLYSDADAADAATSTLEYRLLERGVGCRTIYDHRVFDMPGTLRFIERLVEAGEEARFLADVPTKLAIADAQLAMVPLNMDQPHGEGAALVHSSALLDALAALFERLWRVATPLRDVRAADAAGGGDGLSADEHRLLAMMLSGMTDEALGRQFAVSQRTLYRRIKSLMERLGVDTRLQLIWQATQRGWL